MAQPPSDSPPPASDRAQGVLRRAAHARVVAQVAREHGDVHQAMQQAYHASTLAVRAWLWAWLGITPPTPRAVFRAWETFLLRPRVAAHLGVSEDRLTELARHLELAWRFLDPEARTPWARLPRSPETRAALTVVLHRTDRLLALAERAVRAGPPPPPPPSCPRPGPEPGAYRPR